MKRIIDTTWRDVVVILFWIIIGVMVCWTLFCLLIGGYLVFSGGTAPWYVAPTPPNPIEGYNCYFEYNLQVPGWLVEQIAQVCAKGGKGTSLDANHTGWIDWDSMTTPSTTPEAL